MPKAFRHVLCIDDDPQSLKVRKVLLETYGFAVQTAGSGPEGLRVIRGHEFDAVVLDYHMPGMDGGEVAREVKKWDPSLPVLILSALPWLPDDAPQECIDAFVSKGGPTLGLVNRLEGLIDSRTPAMAGMGKGRNGRVARYVGAAAGLMAATFAYMRHRKPAHGDATKQISRIVA